ncbi:MAG: copper amine oxidase N-terminal domain-containing protein [Thermotaleaceae bacterium]
MKKTILVMIIIVMTVLGVSMSIYGLAVNDIWVTVNGDVLTFDQPPIIINQRVMVPLRAIFEALECTVDWNSKMQMITAYSPDMHILEIHVGETSAYKDGELIKMDVPAKIVNGRTLVPVRFVAEALDCKVEWENSSKKVIITKKSSDAIEGMPTFKTDSDVLEVKNIFGGAEKYTRYVSYDILKDLNDTKGPLSDSSSGMWFLVFELMGYGKDAVPAVVDCWKNPYGQIAFILPNGNIYMGDRCYEVLVANNVEDKEVKKTFFYENNSLDFLAGYLIENAPMKVRLFIDNWYKGEFNKQKEINDWTNNWNF